MGEEQNQLQGEGKARWEASAHPQAAQNVARCRKEGKRPKDTSLNKLRGRREGRTAQSQMFHQPHPGHIGIGG